MSANLLDGITPTLMSGTTESDGVWHCPAKDGKHDSLAWNFPGMSALSANQTLHLGLSAKGASADASDLHMVVAYRDAAGNYNWAWGEAMPVGTSWGRAEATVVIPSGMTMTVLTVSTRETAKVPEVWMAAPTLSLGSPVCLASSAHTPYATQDHVAAEYATKAALKVTSDAVTAEVTERGKLAGRVGTLESTTGTHTSKLEQLAASIKSLVRGESTYTDPDGKSATSGIYSLVEQTRDSVTALFGSYTKTTDMQSQIATARSQATSAANSATDSKLASYTKTADLASTAAVRDAKRAGTDAASAASAAASAASAAQSTANTAKSNAATAQSTADAAKTAAASAQSTASAAKSTADGLATMIRQDADGVTVGKSADGKTWSTGRTRMTDIAFQILDKAGATVTQMAKDGASFLAGLVRLQVHEVNSNSVVSMISDFLSIDSTWQATMRAGKETSGAYVDGYAAAIADVTGRRGTARLYCTQGDGSYITANNMFEVLPDGYDLSQPEYLAAALLGTGGGGSGVTHSQDAVTMASDLDECGPGVFSYNASTANRPTDYGTCVCIRAGDGTDTGTWLFQLALPTVGEPHWRRNINGGGWSAWWQWATS